MKPGVIAFAVTSILMVAAIIAWHALSAGASYVDVGTFLVLTLTLAVLVWYAYDTNSIARITRDRWLREAVLGTAYELAWPGDKGGEGLTLFRLHNTSNLVVYVRMNCNLRLYGRPLKETLKNLLFSSS